MEKFKFDKDTRNVYLNTGDETKDLLVLKYIKGIYTVSDGIGYEAVKLSNEASKWLSRQGTRRNAEMPKNLDRNLFCKVSKCLEFSIKSQCCTTFNGCCGFSAKDVFRILNENDLMLITKGELDFVDDLVKKVDDLKKFLDDNS